MNLKENQTVEFKQSWKDDYLQYVSGFANAKGGTLYIGIDDDGNVCGVKNAKKLLVDIPNKVRDTMGMYVNVNLLIDNNLEYLQIDVPPCSMPITYKGKKLQIPVFAEVRGGFSATIKRERFMMQEFQSGKSDEVSGQDGSRNGQKSSQKSSQKILSMIKENPEISTQEIADILNISRRAVTKQIAKLKEQGAIRRVGADKGGHWEIVDMK